MPKTNKEEPMPTVQSIISLVQTNAAKAKNVQKGRAANANILSSVGKLIGIWQSLKKGEARIGPQMVLSFIQQPTS